MEKELITIEKKTALQVFTSGDVDAIIKQAKEVVDNFEHDLSTGVSRARTASLASKVSKLKVKIDGIGKELVEDWKAKAKAVDVPRKKLRDAFDLLRDEARKPLTDWENAEKERVDTIRFKIDRIKGLTQSLLIDPDPSMSVLLCGKKSLLDVVIDETFEEFELEAAKELEESLRSIDVLIKNKQEALDQAAELRKLKKEKEERDQKDRDDALRKEAADKAIEDNRLANEKIAREKQDAIDAKEKAERDAEIAEERRLDAVALSEKKAEDAREEEIQKQKDKEDAEKAEEAKRLANRDHTGKIRKAAKECLMEYVDEATAKRIVLAIDQNRIEHVSIRY